MFEQKCSFAFKIFETGKGISSAAQLCPEIPVTDMEETELAVLPPEPAQFSPEAIMNGIFELFSTRLATCGQFAGTVGLLKQFGDMTGMAALRNQLVAAGTITEDDATAINALFLSQGVDLNSPS